MFETILVPTDGSESATRAVETGVALAGRDGAAIHALYVIDSRFVADGFDIPVERAEAAAEAALDRAATAGEAAGIDVERHLRRGLPHEQILAAVEDYGADLIVIGGTGATGLDRLVQLGSVAERVIRRAPIHVLVAPP